MSVSLPVLRRSTIKRVNVLGVPVDAICMAEAITFVESALESRSDPACILAVNPNKVMTLSNDAGLLEFFSGVDLLIPDGAGLVWAVRTLHGVSVARVAGADLMPEICALSARMGAGVYLFGAKERVNALAAQNLERMFPGLRIAGRQHGYVSEDGDPLVEDINRSQADVLFVALGSPRQEKWIAEHRARLRVKVIQGVGGTFDVIAGSVRRAPKAWQRANGEWLYRLVREPHRIRRQMDLPRFAWRVLKLRYLGAG